MNTHLENSNKFYTRFNFIEKNTYALKAKMENLFSGVHIKNVIIPPNFILSKNEEKYLIYFAEENQISLMEYIVRKQKLNEDEIITIILSIGNLIKKINEKGYILGSIELEDIWLTNEDLSTLFIRQRKSLFKENDNNNIKYNCSSICTLEVRNEKYSNINKNTDLELYGRIFMRIIIPNRIINDYKELRYLAYNIRLFNDKIPLYFQTWLNKITSIYEDKKFKSIDDAIDFIKENYNKKQIKSSDTLGHLYSCITHPGRGKITKLTEKKLDSIDNINQDSMFIYDNNDKVFAMVADGVSNCTYGSGYKASSIVKEVCKNKVTKNIDLINENNVWNFYEDLINNCNEQICSEVLDLYPSSDIDDDIMASTFISCFIKNNKLFIASIGDSKCFLYRDGTAFQINTSDNVGNDYLRNNRSWKDYLNLKKSSALTKYIGDMDIDNENILIPQMIELDIQSEDIIIICSDGLTDYLYDIGDKGDLWNVNNNIENIIQKNYDKNLGYINWKLVNKANFNGGWDNISSILIKII